MAIDPHKFDRRQFLSVTAGAAAMALFGPARSQAVASRSGALGVHYIASCREGTDRYAAVAFTPEGKTGTRIALPARGHDIALRPGTSECVVFARRPGTFAIAFDAAGQLPPQSFAAHADRHFFGHGVFSADGRLLYSTENDFAGERGMIGVRDATDRYRQIGEFASGGIGPHDIALLSDGQTLVTANGGIETNPESGRAPLNLDTMQPSLAYIDLRSGDIIEQQMLAPELHQLSIRHLAVAAGDVVIFGCQHEGDGSPALVGWHKRGSNPVLFEAPDESYSAMKNYVGSIAADTSGSIVSATSPRGGHVLFFDVTSRRLIGEAAIRDVCGVASRHRGEGFVLTTGMGGVAERDPIHRSAAVTVRQIDGLAFDNHAVSF